MGKLISIIIPVYNAEAYIKRCLVSVYTQNVSEDKYDVIVVNDGSTDTTLEILQAYTKQHVNLRILNQENKGVSSARNIGISNAESDYVLFLDADDELIADSLSKICEYLKLHGPMDMLVTRQVRNNGEKEWVVDSPSLIMGITYSGIDAYRCRYVRTNAGGGICRTQFLKQYNLQFPEGVTNGEDTIFFGLVQVYSRSIEYYNFLTYRIHEIAGSATRIDNTQMGLRLINSMKSVAAINRNLHLTKEQQGIFDFVIYQMLSNLTYYFVCSKELTYKMLRNMLDFNGLLPTNPRYMHMMRIQSRLMNLSFPLFYMFSWFKHRLD